MVINILTGHEKNLENLSETPNRDRKQKKNKPEMKNSITKVTYTLEGVNSRLKESKE